MTRLALLCSIAAILACSGAKPVALTTIRSTTPAPTGALQVGVARVDVTPPPGVSTFGHAPDAHVTNGYWTRLYCRVFVLATSETDRVVLVPCDLAAISALLHHSVIDRVAKDPVTAAIPGTHIMIAATHTHAGPAHYFEGYAYGSTTSTRLPGFDPHMVDFLAERIADGIHSAVQSLRPAVARWRHESLWGVTRNRSLSPFLTNKPTVNFGKPDLPDDALPEERAIDPRLDVLEFEAAGANDQNAGPLGWLVLFAMHPTVLPSSNRLLGADTHGIISRLLESQLRRVSAERKANCLVSQARADSCVMPTDDPLVGVFNTNEGDVSPKWLVGNSDEVVTVARKVAEKAFATYDSPSPWRTSITLDAHYIQTKLSNAPLLNGRDRLCKRPELGNATGHGGSDHRTSLDSILPLASDVDPGRTDCQKPKRTLLGSVQRWLIGRAPDRYPDDVAFGMVRIDDMWLTFVPGELTVHAGKLVNDRVLGFAGKNAETRVVGLANGYIQYIATEPEYALQHYEGGSTLFGPKSAEYFADQAEILARAMRGQALPNVDEIRQPDYELGPIRSRLPMPDDAAPATSLGSQRAKGGLCTMPGGPKASLCFWWVDAAPAVVLHDRASWLQLIDAKDAPVRVCESWPSLKAIQPSSARACDPSAAIDDRGIDFLTKVGDRVGGGYTWGTLLKISESEWPDLDQAVRIRAQGPTGVLPVDSDAFSYSHLPHPCSFAEASHCDVDP